MSKLIDLTGQTFGRLTVLSRGENRSKMTTWNCVCECGNKTSPDANSLRRGKSKSCGCLVREKAKQTHQTHGETKTSEYRTWSSMIQRTINKNRNGFNRYGGRGIAVCDRWRHSYESFIYDMGYKPSPKHTIERVDNNKGYNPCNCYWATMKQQANNKRNNTSITHNGVTKNMTQWSETTGIKKNTLAIRLNKLHWSVKKALETPVKYYRPRLPSD